MIHVCCAGKVIKGLFLVLWLTTSTKQILFALSVDVMSIAVDVFTDIVVIMCIVIVDATFAIVPIDAFATVYAVYAVDVASVGICVGVMVVTALV